MTPVSFRGIRRAVLFFFIFFSITAIVQYFFVKTQTESVLNADRQASATELNEAVAYDNGFDAKEYASQQLDATNYVIVLNDGSIIDMTPEIAGLPVSILPRVTSPVLSEAVYSEPTTVTYRGNSKSEERWKLLARKLDRGLVIIGTSEFDKVSLSNAEFSANLDLFGKTLASASKRLPSQRINSSMSWALIDDRGTLINGFGRIPLKTDPMQIGRASTGSPYRQSGDKIYYLSFVPLTDKGGGQVGTILLFDDVTRWKSALVDSAMFSGGIAILSFVVLMILTILQHSRHEKEKAEIREAFQNYFSPQVLEAILREPEQLKEKRREVTVLFSDIRAFTSISERLPPTQLTQLLHEYFNEMTESVFATNGVVDKYIGDAIMAFWGAPVEQPDHANRAVQTAIDMTRRLKKLREKWANEGLPILDIGIGINLGVATVGKFGSARRFDYTVIGDTVNAASRLESLNKELKSHIIISESTKDQLTVEVETRDLGNVQVKGKERPIRIFEVIP